MEPTTASSFAVAKGLSAMSGLFGALSVSFFWKPKAFHEYGKIAAGAIMGGIGVGAAFALGGLLINYFNLDPTSVDVALGIGYLVGVVSVGIIGFLANFFKAREHQDILQVAREIKTTAKNANEILHAAETIKKPARKTPVKRVKK